MAEVTVPEGSMATGSSRADRLTSFSAADFAIPSGSEEDWRFTPLDRIADFLSDDFTAQSLTYESRPAMLETVGRDDPRLGRVLKPEDRAGAVAWEAFDRAYVLTIKAGEPQDVSVVAHVPHGMHAAHLVVIAEPGAQGTVVVEHTGDGDLTEGVEIDVREGANLTFVSVQEGGSDARYVSSHRVTEAKDAVFRHIVVTLSGAFVRMTSSLAFTGEHADAKMLGAYLTDSGQHSEHHVFVDHEAPDCKSRVTYKGAVQGENTSAVWIGDALVGPEADGTDSYEMNRNLVLTRGAEVNSVPNLEIETGKILQCGHASTSGRFDEEQLFYLQARGIPEALARRLVIRGFFAELIDQIDIESVRTKLLDAIDHELDLSAALTGDETASVPSVEHEVVA
ncbi:MAG: Fe-S cluster assembly protein SufD [Actinomycetaceae bacterium]|nr:Fe-S cluster assembly protein SufD [Actinomycetaceae bacterium]MDY6083237.1 Fe-S cluster assembly protein SufD [Actinomycetaceae bacterium]